MSEGVDRVAITEMYQRLIQERDKAIDANDSIERDIETSRNFQEEFCCSDPFYIEQVEVVKASMPDDVTSGTVGAYLYGCFQPELAVEIGCTPACSDGLKNPDIDDCNIASYEKEGGELRKLNEVNTEEANVFVAENEKITLEDRQQLRQDGVGVITTFNQDGNSINYVLGESIDLDQPEYTEPPPEEESSTWYWGWILIFFAITIAVGSAIAFLR